MPLLTLLIGVVACATSVIWIKFSAVDPVLLTGLRLVIAALILAPLALRDWRRHRQRLTWGHLRDSAIPGLVLTAHFVSWMAGARMTLATNGSLVVNMSPIVMPFLLAALLGERVTRREIAATVVAAAGLAVLFVSDYRLSSETLTGDLICFASMLMMALYLALGRKFRHHPTNLLYVTPLYGVAGLAALALTPWLSSWRSVDWRAEWPWVALLALAPTIVGHSLLLGALRHFRGQVVAVVSMTQFVFAGVMAWLALGERPEPPFYVASALILSAGLIVVGVTRGRR